MAKASLQTGRFTDDLVPVIDEVRDCLNEDLGLRQYRCYVVRRAWSADRRGEGYATDHVVELVPRPKILDPRQVRGVLRPLGLEEEGDIVLTEVSLTMTERELYLGDDVERTGAQEPLIYVLDDDRGQDGRRRYYVPSRPPVADRDKSLGWIVTLRRIDDLPDFTLEGDEMSKVADQLISSELDLAVNGGTTPVTLSYTPPAGKNAILTKVAFSLDEQSGTFYTLQTFAGQGAALANGIEVELVDAAGTVLFSFATITKDADWAKLGARDQLSVEYAGEFGFWYGYHFEWDLAGHYAGGIKLEPGQSLRFTVNDDLTGITELSATVKGHLENV